MSSKHKIRVACKIYLNSILGEMSAITRDLDNLVRVSVKIHAVNVQTGNFYRFLYVVYRIIFRIAGHYIQSLERPVALPLRTRYTFFSFSCYSEII